MSDRTPEQVAEETMDRVARTGVILPLSMAWHFAAALTGALRVEGMLVEPGEVKVRLDGLEQRILDAWWAELSEPTANRNALVRIAARVVRGDE